MELVVLGVVFVATLGLLVGTFVFINRRRLSASAAARNRLEFLDPRTGARSLIREDSASDLPFLNRLISGRPVTGELHRELQMAGVSLSPGSFMLTVVAGAGGGALLGLVMLGMLAAFIGAATGGALPVVWLRRKRGARRSKFENQLPEAIDMLVTAMRSGYSFQAAMKFIGEEMPAPLGPEFGRFYDEQRLGMEVREALLLMQDRVDSLDFRMFVTAILIQRETGGTLSDVLSNIADVMRQRVAVRGQIETLTAEPKLSAKILSGLPVVVFLGLSLINPEYVRPLTTTQLGFFMLGTATAMVLFGYFVLMQLADIDY